MMNKLMIKELRAQTGLSQSQFAARFQIPVRTLQNWEQGRQEPPPYVVAMMERILELEKGRWIPVTKRLPKKEDANPNESVLAIAKDDGFARSWIWDIVARYPQEFTHWMPMPAIEQED